MDLDKSKNCTPAIVYVVISIILMLCMSSITIYQRGLIEGSVSSIFGSSFQLSSICGSAIILLLLCNFDVHPAISWAIVIAWLFCYYLTIMSGIITAVSSPMQPTPKPSIQPTPKPSIQPTPKPSIQVQFR